MEAYDENLTVTEALVVFFDKFGFSLDDYQKRWFVIKVGPVPFYLPNIASRVTVAKFHDIHHILTGYPANWRGEAEIGAWEVATGCRTYWVAWFLNLGAVGVGLFFCPKAVFRAFRRGLKTRTNLYHGFDYDQLLHRTVKDLRSGIGVQPL